LRKLPPQESRIAAAAKMNPDASNKHKGRDCKNNALRQLRARLHQHEIATHKAKTAGNDHKRPKKKRQDHNYCG
jgi:hypothetical protein